MAMVCWLLLVLRICVLCGVTGEQSIDCGSSENTTRQARDIQTLAYDYSVSYEVNPEFLDSTEEKLGEEVVGESSGCRDIPKFHTRDDVDRYILETLLEDYDPTLVPQAVGKPESCGTRGAASSSEFKKLGIDLDFVLMQIIDISATDGAMSSSGALAIQYQDGSLDYTKLPAFDPDHPVYFENCDRQTKEKDHCLVKPPDSLEFPSDKLWTPEITLMNNAGNENNGFKQKPYFILFPGGYVYRFPLGLFTASCDMDMRLFPFDHQHCSLEFGSAIYTRKEIDFRIMKLNSNAVRSAKINVTTESNEHFECDSSCSCKGAQIDHTMGVPLGLNRARPTKTSQLFGDDVASLDCAAFQPNGEWDILDGKAEIFVQDSRQIVRYTFVLKRKPLFYIINMLIPILLLSGVSLFEFYLPSDSGEKMTLSISLTLGQVIFLFLVATRIPRTSESVPFICLYLLFSMVLVIITSGINLLICNIHFRSSSTHDLNSMWKRIFMLKLGPMIGMRRPGKLPDFGEDQLKMPRRAKYSNYDYNPIRDSSLRRRSEKSASKVERKSILKKNKTDFMPSYMLPVVDSVKFISKNMEDDQQNRSDVDDWKWISMIIDRFLLYLYGAAMILGSIWIFMEIYTTEYPMARRGFDIDCKPLFYGQCESHELLSQKAEWQKILLGRK